MRINRGHASLCLLASLAAFFLGEAARSVGAPPADDDKKAGVRFEDGTPVAEMTPDGLWKVKVVSKYRYDAGWEFKEMKIQVYLVKKDDKEPKSVMEAGWPNEAAIGIKGQVSGAYSMRIPGEGETIVIKSIMVAKHPIFGEQEWSISSPVLPPVKK